MNNINKKKPSLFNVYGLTARAVLERPQVVIPFVIFLLVELVCLTFIYLAPRVPFNKVLAPPIIKFKGAQFLHYPANFLIMPELDSLTRNFLSVVLASLLTGWAVLLLKDVYAKQKPKMWQSLRQAAVQYFPLLGVVLIMVGVFSFVNKFLNLAFVKYFVIARHPSLLGIDARLWFNVILVAVKVLMILLIQGLLVYAFPYLMIGKQRFFTALARSLGMFFRHFGLTMLLLAIPYAVFVPVMVLQGNAAFVIDRMFPEAVLILTVIGAAVSSLVVDLLVTVSTTFVYLKANDNA